MKIGDILKNKFTVSFEFFPPKSEDAEKELFGHIAKLKPLGPQFVTVTYGAGGSTREKTRNIVIKMAKDEGLNVMAHLTCINHTKKEILEILKTYQDNGIDDILALRGDTPADMNIKPEDGELAHAIDLVRLIKDNFGDYYSIGGAAFPERHSESPNMDWEMRFFKEKVDAGLDFATTQLFFINRYYYEYLEWMEKYGISIPVLPGIMPITNYKQISRMADLSHSEIPVSLTSRMEKYGDNSAEVSKIGIEYSVKQCEDLLKNGVKGLHFYTMNKSMATIEICEAIKGKIK